MNEWNEFLYKRVPKQVKRDIKYILTCKRSCKIYLNVFSRVLESLSSPMCVGKGFPFGKKKKWGMALWGRKNHKFSMHMCIMDAFNTGFPRKTENYIPGLSRIFQDKNHQISRTLTGISETIFKYKLIFLAFSTSCSQPITPILLHCAVFFC